MGGKGNEGVAGMIRQLSGAIGYVELIYAVQNNIPYGSVRNSAGDFRESIAGKRDRGSRVGPEDAGRFPGLHYQCSRKRCLSDFQLHLATDSGSVQGCCER